MCQLPDVEGYIISSAREHGVNPQVALEVAKAESGVNPTAYNPEWHRGCQGSYGVFQIACVNYSGDSRDLYDPYLNVDIAMRVQKEQGWQAWGVCGKSVNCTP